ncbi:Peroxisomal membrane protein PEX13 [Orchesella cincta]|uniref:Peroxisomal membrane protein PEX13 n=1 Tax=Orchesella cincta TaxID=48709 RepID=A0A1D2N6Y1_ORCCI|nr:Peroxisomal membrane protein PEX13 [Orchesella cincta]
MKSIVAIALLAFVACANAGVLGHPVYHGPAIYHHAPIVKAVHHHPLYAVPPPILAKPIVYAPAPVVKVFHPAPVVKHVSFGPVAYGHAYGAYGAYGLHGPAFF